jgi:hypothetical protein
MSATFRRHRFARMKSAEARIPRPLHMVSRRARPRRREAVRDELVAVRKDIENPRPDD